MVNKAIKDLVGGGPGETSISITLSDVNRHGYGGSHLSSNLLEKFQTLQEKIDQKDEIIKLAQ